MTEKARLEECLLKAQQTWENARKVAYQADQVAWHARLYAEARFFDLQKAEDALYEHDTK